MAILFGFFFVSLYRQIKNYLNMKIIQTICKVSVENASGHLVFERELDLTKMSNSGVYFCERNVMEALLSLFWSLRPVVRFSYKQLIDE